MVVPTIAESEEGDGDLRENYIEFQPLSVTVIQNARISGVLTVTFTLATKNPSLIEKIKHLRPRVRSEVHHKLARLAATRISLNQPINVELVGKFIQSAVDQIFGEHEVEVLIQLAAIRPL